MRSQVGVVDDERSGAVSTLLQPVYISQHRQAIGPSADLAETQETFNGPSRGSSGIGLYEASEARVDLTTQSPLVKLGCALSPTTAYLNSTARWPSDEQADLSEDAFDDADAGDSNYQ
jgi:hypothetical protein